MSAGANLPEVELEIQTERSEAIPLSKGSYAGPILRVKYRPVGKRAWTRFVLVPNEGEGYDELERDAAGAVAAHRRRAGGET